jgi:hypothetical protein
MARGFLQRTREAAPHERNSKTALSLSILWSDQAIDGDSTLESLVISAEKAFYGAGVEFAMNLPEITVLLVLLNGEKLEKRTGQQFSHRDSCRPLFQNECADDQYLGSARNQIQESAFNGHN